MLLLASISQAEKELLSNKMRNNLFTNRNTNDSDKQAACHDAWNHLADSAVANKAKPNVVQQQCYTIVSAFGHSRH